MNQYYSEELSQKTKRGLHETRLKGNFIGGTINYGWSLVPINSEANAKKDQTAHKIIINEEEAHIVKRIFDDYAGGKSVYAIVKELNAQGIKNRGKPFITGTIYTMLNREKYTGIYRVNDYVYDNLYPAIISAQEYELVRKRLIENGAGKHIPDVSYILRGKVDCGYCGKRFTSYGGKDRYGKQRRYYKCYGTKGCKCKAVRKEQLEEMVILALNKALSSDDNINLLITAILDSIDKNNADNLILRVLERDLEKTEKTMVNIMNAIKMGIVTETTKASLEECETDKKELIRKIQTERVKEKPRPTREQLRNYILSALKKPTALMIDLLVQKVVVFNDRIEITLKYVNGSPSDDRPKKLNKHIVKKTNLDSGRGSLFMSFDYPYISSKLKVFNKTFSVMLFV